MRIIRNQRFTRTGIQSQKLVGHFVMIQPQCVDFLDPIDDELCDGFISLDLIGNHEKKIAHDFTCKEAQEG